MNIISRKLKPLAAAFVSAVIGLAVVTTFGQGSDQKDKSKAEHKEKNKAFCSNNNWSSEKVSFSELREVTIPATGTVKVNGGQNGGISVNGGDRSDVLVRACVQAWATTEDGAKAAVANIRVNTGGEIRAENSAGDKNWGVSYQILVPRATNLDLTAHNGGISISGTDGTAEFETMNGGISLYDLAGSVRGRTTNGGVKVTLSGKSWKGSGLDLQTTNGGIKLTIPENYAANIETGTVNGGYKSDIPELNITTENIKGNEAVRHRPRRIQTSINGGGAPIKVITTNGGVNISTTSGETRVM